ncbi:testis-expressed protein 22 isoform X1 [Callithrix jacchus]|uniref:testis-expressed protein 22 isoform X1 n=1 Tax=Callithrix jacchus TaxID=9483 RepID=UPI0023DD22E6|nr:testis-expressed protein 22 isoform X1 [Callithrix jacchus]XP_054096396.1 testis-expressed protein 22 isoform X1 [Callithrix jacchus]
MDSRKLAPQGKKLEFHLSQEHRWPPLGPAAASGQPSTQSSAQQGLQTQDWVSEPPERRCPGRHWSVSIDERRRLAMLGGWERPGTAGGPHHCRVCRGHRTDRGPAGIGRRGQGRALSPPNEVQPSTNAFLARSAPFWHNMTFKAQASRSPHS